MIKAGRISDGHPEGANATMIKRRQDPKRNGTCELCGGHGRELQILAQADFIGWACEVCREQLARCQVRRFMNAGEHTETAE